MRRSRFTIANLLVVVLFVAVAALRAADDPWDTGVFNVTLLALSASILLAIHRRERERAFWLGFCLIGGSYLGASLVPPIESRLATTKLLTYLDSKVPGRPRSFVVTMTANVSGPTNALQSFAFAPDGHQLAITRGSTIRLWDAVTGRVLGGASGTSENFVRIGHSLLVLVLAYLGGLLSRSLHASGRTSRAEGANLHREEDTGGGNHPPAT